MRAKVDLLERTLSQIESCLETDLFVDVENLFIELKDLSTGDDWRKLKEVVCGFLNTSGGYIICGVRERNKKYTLSGFNRNNESKVIDLRNKFFKNDVDVLVDLSDYILFEYKSILGKEVVVITVMPLSEDIKYLKYEQIHYQRDLTQTSKISDTKLAQHNEYKAELQYAKEIAIVPDATIADLNIDKINQYIVKINTTGKKETVKKDATDAIDFLKRRNCILDENQVTILGLLLFGEDPSRYLENRARVDCYFETGNDIGRDKKYLEDDVLNLMDDAFSFVWGHIKVGRSYIGGGRSEPEFPEKLIREVINNALAHRDYTINKFISIKINPGESLEIKNPGNFKQKMLVTNTSSGHDVRRIIAGDPQTKNPKLAAILKTFEKLESQGIGMATMVDACLNSDTNLDVPYFNLSISDTISLVIPSGKLVDDDMVRWIDSFRGYIQSKLGRNLTQAHISVLAYLFKSERLNQKMRYTILLSPSNNHLDVLHDLSQANLIMEHPMASTIHAPIYILNNELTKTNFLPQIALAVGKENAHLSDIQKQVLNIIYRYNHYNDETIKPNKITPELYSNIHGSEINPTTYESLGRQVRKICADLLKDEYILKREDGSYEVNIRPFI
jgi:ATP-dependent DNA helicase RecG